MPSATSPLIHGAKFDAQGTSVKTCTVQGGGV
jgi:hypothetical protein